MRHMTTTAAAAVLITAAQASATKLTFDIDTDLNADGQQQPGNSSAVDQGYGDNVTATQMGGFFYGDDEGFTPNVVVDYGPQHDHWGTGYGDLVNIVFDDRERSANDFNITLTADAGWLVQLHSFDLASFGGANAERLINSVSVWSGDEKLFELLDAVIFDDDGAGGDPDHNSFVFDEPLVGQSLTLRFDSTNQGGAADDIGMDNIVFSQIPAPGVGALLGLAGLAAVRRRNG